MINKNEKEIIIFLRKNTEEKKVTKSNHIIRELLAIAYKQIVNPKPRNAKVYITMSALDNMAIYGISREKVTDTALNGQYIQGKRDRIVKKYNGYTIGTITKYNSTTNTYVVLTAWKN